MVVDFVPREVPRRVELWETVLETLRLAIVSGDLPQGTRLVEADLSAKLKVSRGPIRDALMHLEREGLVESLPTRGLIVAGLSETDVREVYGLRATLEQMAVRLILDRPTCPDLEPLERLVAEMEQAQQGQQWESVATLDIAFHRQVVALAGHRRLSAAWEGLAGTLRSLLSITNAVYSDLPHVAAEHRALVTALAARDLEAAEEVATRQIVHGEQLILTTIREREAPGGR